MLKLQLELKVDETLSLQLSKFSDKAILPHNLLEHILTLFPDSLPHPLIFRAQYGKNVVHMGVKEFSGVAREKLGLPWVIQQELGLTDESIRSGVAVVNISLVDAMEKGTSISLKPIKRYSEVPNWKYFLESKLRSYTTLTKGSMLYLEGQGLDEVFELYIEDIEPVDTVCIIDTDLNLDIIQETIEENLDNIDDGSNRVMEDVQMTLDVKLGDRKVFKVKKEKLLNKTLTLRPHDGDTDNVDLVLGDQFVSETCYTWTTLLPENAQELDRENEDEWAYVIPFVWDHGVTVDIVISDIAPKEASTEVDAVGEDMTICDNCSKVIPKSSLVLHENFCKRNNIKCLCGKIFLRHIPDTHWKCEHCSQHGDTPLLFAKHSSIYHEGPYSCTQCSSEKIYDSSVELVLHHLSTECPSKLHECQFCHLVVPQELATYQDKYNNLTHHENGCGNKTTECFKCSKIVKQKDVANHMRAHELEKVEKNDMCVLSQRNCTNQNCVNILNTEYEYELCDICFGTVYSSVYDPTHVKLQGRIERKYVIQLSKGCGQPWCKNAECKLSGMSPVRSMSETLAHVGELLGKVNHPPLPINQAHVKMERNAFWFCVDQNTTKRRMMVDHLCMEDEFKPELIYKAVNEVKEVSEEGIRGWLEENAVRVN